MAQGRAQSYLVCYDIADPKRLGRVHRFLREHGIPVQYSVFTAQATAKQLARIIAGLMHRIDRRADDVRIYPLPSRPETVSLGLQLFPEGVLLMEKGQDLLRPRR
jgi:CRISPR-associated protein Cas2